MGGGVSLKDNTEFLTLWVKTMETRRPLIQV